jgi:hypothetical protein
MASCSAGTSTSSPASPRRNPNGTFPPKIPAPRLLISLHLSDTFANAVAFGLGEGGGDREEQLRQPVAGNVAAQVEQMEGDAPLLQILDHLERIEGRAEQAIELRGDHHVALRQLGEQGAGGGSRGDGDGTGDAFLDHDPFKDQAVHVGVAFDLATLDFEAFALGSLFRG